MKKHEITAIIAEKTSQGVEKIDIVKHLISLGMKEKKADIAVATYLVPEDAQRHHKLIIGARIAAVILLILSYLGGVSFSLDKGMDVSISLLLGLIVCIMPGITVYYMFKNSAKAYMFMMILLVLQISHIFRDSDDLISAIIAIGIDVLFIVFLGYVLNKLFPHFGVGRKKKNGRYIL